MRTLTVRGWIYTASGSFGHSLNKYSREATLGEHETMKRLHFIKIFEADAVIVVTDSSGYYGLSTEAEIDFASLHKKPIFFFDGNKLEGHTNATPPQGRFKDAVEALKSYEQTNPLGY